LVTNIFNPAPQYGARINADFQDFKKTGYQPNPMKKYFDCYPMRYALCSLRFFFIGANPRLSASHD